MTATAIGGRRHYEVVDRNESDGLLPGARRVDQPRGNENLQLRPTADQREPLVLGRFQFWESGHRVWAFRTMSVCPTACSGSTNDTLTARAFKRRLPLNKAF
jgi:hypothetical protein